MKIHKKLEKFQYNIFLFYLPEFFFSSSAYASRVQSKQICSEFAKEKWCKRKMLTTHTAQVASIFSQY